MAFGFWQLAKADYSVAGLKSWYHRRNFLFVLCVIGAEAMFEFRVFQSNHDRARGGGKCGEGITDSKSSCHAPRDHLEKMRQIDRVTYMASYAALHEALLGVITTKFRESSQLLGAKTLAGLDVQPDASSE